MQAQIIKLIEAVLGQKIQHNVAAEYLLTVPEPVEVNEIDLLNYGLRNYDLLTQDVIARQIKYQVQRSKILASPTMGLKANAANLDFEQQWAQFKAKLATLIEVVEYRVQHGFAFNTILPTQKELLELQAECLQLTAQWYGKNNANINLVYLAFVKMCQIANIVRYDYYKIKKYSSADKYVSQRDIDHVRHYSSQYKQNYYQPFIAQGGRFAHGRSEIDATAIANVFYYKHARQLFYLEYAKRVIVTALQLEDYGQLPAIQRAQLWQLLKETFPADTKKDEESIFYKFASYINSAPGEYFNYFGDELPAARTVAPSTLYEVIKFCGLQCGKLNIVSRTVTEDWMPKRYLSLVVQRRYPLQVIEDNGQQTTLRNAKTLEHLRIWPNELPYYPEHGMGLCGDGLIEGLEHYGTTRYEWNTPFDPGAEFGNKARDVEILFRQLKLLSPTAKERPLLPGEQPLSIFQSPFSYSSIPQTSHTHINRGTVTNYLLYQLPAFYSHYAVDLAATFEMVQVGKQIDALYLRVTFANLENEALIQFLQQLCQKLAWHFGTRNFDAALRLFQETDGTCIFILEPHVLLTAVGDGTYLNPESHQISLLKPQWVMAEGEDIGNFNNQLAEGLEFIRDFFDQICKLGVRQFLQDLILSADSGGTVDNSLGRSRNP